MSPFIVLETLSGSLEDTNNCPAVDVFIANLVAFSYKDPLERVVFVQDGGDLPL